MRAPGCSPRAGARSTASGSRTAGITSRGRRRGEARCPARARRSTGGSQGPRHFPFGPKLWRHAPAAIGRGRRRMRVDWLPPGKEAALPDEELRAVKVPALIVHGSDDWLISARHADRYVATLPSARRLDIPRGLHGEYLVTSHGDELIEAIRSFLDGRA